MCGLAWPVIKPKHTANAYTYFLPDLRPTAKPEFLVCIDPAEWEACTFSWCSPPQQFMKIRAKCNELAPDQQSLHMVMSSDGVHSLLQTAALHAFWDFPQTLLSKIMKERWPDDYAAEDDDFDTVRKVVKAALKCSDVTTSAILRKRVLKPSLDAEAVLELDENADFLERDDLKELLDVKSKQNSKKHDESAFADKWRTSQSCCFYFVYNGADIGRVCFCAEFSDCSSGFVAPHRAAKWFFKSV
jgi:hypothetical protein